MIQSQLPSAGSSRHSAKFIKELCAVINSAETSFNYQSNKSQPHPDVLALYKLFVHCADHMEQMLPKEDKKTKSKKE